MYWWYNAAKSIQNGETERFGFITTNSITQLFNRQIIQSFLNDDKHPLSLIFAVPSHPWIESGDGAAVRIAMTAAQAGKSEGELLEVENETLQDDGSSEIRFKQPQLGGINADLTIGADLDTALTLKSNDEICNLGMSLYGAGFMLLPEEAPALGLGRISGLEQHIRPYLNGRDLVQTSRGFWVIDLYGLTPTEIQNRFPEVFQRILERVKPERDQNRDKSTRENWWQFGRPRQDFRPIFQSIPRFIITALTAKHRVFQFVEQGIIPDDSLAVVASDDAYHLGVLSSRIHVVWALAAGADLGGNTPRYRKSRCFDPFPFPAATPAQQARIRELAEQLEAHRKRQQAQHPSLTLTDLYNVVEKLRANQPLTVKDQTVNQQGLASVVLSLHQQLDAAVADAYGWPTTLPDAEILARLVHLNHERTREEQQGHIRYLRPSYQAPGEQQSAMELPTATTAVTAATTAAAQPWPAELAQQMFAVRSVVQQAGGEALSSAQVAACFRRTKADKVKPLLDTLAMMSLVRHLETEDTYAA